MIASACVLLSYHGLDWCRTHITREGAVALYFGFLSLCWSIFMARLGTSWDRLFISTWIIAWSTLVEVWAANWLGVQVDDGLVLWWASCVPGECWLGSCWHSELLRSLSPNEWRLGVSSRHGSVLEIVNVCRVLGSCSGEAVAVILLVHRLCCPQELSWSDFILLLTIVAMFLSFSLASSRNWRDFVVLIISCHPGNAIFLLSVEWSIWCIFITSDSQNAALRLWFARDGWEHWASICIRLIVKKVAWSVQNAESRSAINWFSLNLMFVIIELGSLHNVCRCRCIIAASERSSKEVLEGLVNFVLVIALASWCALLVSDSKHWLFGHLLERIVVAWWFWLSFWGLGDNWRDVGGWGIGDTTWAVEGIIVLAVWSDHNWIDDWAALSAFGFDNWAILSTFGLHQHIIANLSTDILEQGGWNIGTLELHCFLQLFLLFDVIFFE